MSIPPNPNSIPVVIILDSPKSSDMVSYTVSLINPNRPPFTFISDRMSLSGKSPVFVIVALAPIPPLIESISNEISICGPKVANEFGLF